MDWGVRTACKLKFWVGFYAFLYDRVGFESMGDITVNLEGHNDSAVMAALRLKPHGKDRIGQ